MKTVLDEIKNNFVGSLKAETQRSIMLLRIKKIFEFNFKYNDHGRPRIWDNNVLIDQVYDESLEKVSSNVKIFFLKF
jgi:hypothetical protein